MNYCETAEQLVKHVNLKTLRFDDLPGANKEELLIELEDYVKGKPKDSKYYQAWCDALNMNKDLSHHAYMFRVALTFVDLPTL